MPDFHKPGIYGSVRVRANAWEVFRRTTFRVGRRRRAAVDFVVCYVCGGISFILRFFHFECTRPAASMRPPCFIYLSTSTGPADEMLAPTGAAVYQNLITLNTTTAAAVIRNSHDCKLR